MTCGELDARLQCDFKILWWQRAGRPWWALEDGRKGQATPAPPVGCGRNTQGSLLLLWPGFIIACELFPPRDPVILCADEDNLYSQ